MLAVLDPSGRARGDHGELTAILDAAHQLVSLLNDGQVSGEVHVVHALKAQGLDSGNHLTLAVGAGLIAEALTDLGTDGGSGADQHVLGGVCQSGEYLIGIVTLVEMFRLSIPWDLDYPTQHLLTAI